MIKTMCVCKDCGRTIENEFLYCPWCGGSRLNTSENEEQDEASMDSFINYLVKLQDEKRARQLELMEMQLNELDEELETMEVCYQMSR